jgi:hypothetical protein
MQVVAFSACHMNVGTANGNWRQIDQNDKENTERESSAKETPLQEAMRVPCGICELGESHVKRVSY